MTKIKVPSLSVFLKNLTSEEVLRAAAFIADRRGYNVSRRAMMAALFIDFQKKAGVK